MPQTRPFHCDNVGSGNIASYWELAVWGARGQVRANDLRNSLCSALRACRRCAGLSAVDTAHASTCRLSNARSLAALCKPYTGGSLWVVCRGARTLSPHCMTSAHAISAVVYTVQCDVSWSTDSEFETADSKARREVALRARTSALPNTRSNTVPFWGCVTRRTRQVPRPMRCLSSVIQSPQNRKIPVCHGGPLRTSPTAAISAGMRIVPAPSDSIAPGRSMHWAIAGEFSLRFSEASS